jgi:hypothetical protein
MLKLKLKLKLDLFAVNLEFGGSNNRPQKAFAHRSLKESRMALMAYFGFLADRLKILFENQTLN